MEACGSLFTHLRNETAATEEYLARHISGKRQSLSTCGPDNVFRLPGTEGPAGGLAKVKIDMAALFDAAALFRGPRRGSASARGVIEEDGNGRYIFSRYYYFLCWAFLRLHTEIFTSPPALAPGAQRVPLFLFCESCPSTVASWPNELSRFSDPTLRKTPERRKFLEKRASVSIPELVPCRLWTWAAPPSITSPLPSPWTSRFFPALVDISTLPPLCAIPIPQHGDWRPIRSVNARRIPRGSTWV